MKAQTTRGRDLSSNLRSTSNGLAPAARKSLKRQLHKVERKVVFDDGGREIVLVGPAAPAPHDWSVPAGTWSSTPFVSFPIDGEARALAWVTEVYGPSHHDDPDFIDAEDFIGCDDTTEAEALPGSPGWGDVFDPEDLQWGFVIHREQDARWL